MLYDFFFALFTVRCFCKLNLMLFMTDPQQRGPHLRLLPLCGINPASYDFRLGIIPPPSCQRHRNKCNDPSSVSNTQKQCFARMRLFPTRAQKQLADRRG